MTLELTVNSLDSNEAKDFMLACLGQYSVTVTKQNGVWVLKAEYLGY